MKKKKVENVVGALSLALSDDLLHSTQACTPSSAPSAAIALVGHMPGMSINHMRGALGLSHPGTVRLVDRLVQDDLIQRSRSELDGRAVALTLTPSGEVVCRRILSARQDALSRGIASLNATEQQILGRLAEKMLRSIIRSEEHAIEICRLCDPDVCTNCPVVSEIESREGTEGNIV